ncbi:FGGY-family carbohydrate kinase [Gallaecimonas sp. GXIMD4217]|uniref:FGGY-family carbohydrate kinase n=1 Tax=Gallaecimonas sp. GXIMD4217 TaxID=3131927 RepID=UPI00311AE785
MTRRYLLALDNGTQSVRALLFDLQGNLVAKAQEKLAPPYASPRPGWAEQDPELFWQALCRASKRLLAEHPLEEGQLLAASLTTQRGTFVHLDEVGRPLRPAMVWPDSRRQERLAPLPWYWRWPLRLAGQLGTVQYFRGEAEANWVQANQPEVDENSRHKGLLSAWLTLKLTGRFRDAVAGQVGYLPFSYRHQQWAARWDWKWWALAVKREQLPELVRAGELLGELSPAAALATGLPEGLPLIAAGGDKQCEVLGSGAHELEVACVSLGTTATVSVTTPFYMEAVRFLPPYPAVVPGHYCVEMQLSRGFWLLSWLLREFGQAEVAEAERRGVAPEQVVCELIEQVPPGCEGLVVEPHWAPGIIYPGPEARGAVLGFREQHGRAHLYRAVIEGICFALRQGKERIEKASGRPISRLLISGGGAQSDVVMQIAADVLNLPAERPHTFETSGLGAAMAAAVGVGAYTSFAQASAKMCRNDKVFWPHPEHARHYQQLYKSVYRPAYGRLKPLYQRLRRLLEKEPPR